MPDTGYDPYGGWDTGSPIDNSGGGIDPSYASSLAAGGSFPGAQQNLMQYLAAQSTGANQGNPDYHLPAFLSWLAGHVGSQGSLARNVLGRLTSGHEANVQSPGSGQTPEGLSGGYGYHFFSGPGASYGPADGPGTGLVDFGRGVDNQWDLPESKPPGQSTQGAPGGGKGGGGKGGGHVLNFTPYAGMSFHPSFVDFQPIQPGSSAPHDPTRFVGGGRAATISAAPAPLSPAHSGRHPGLVPAGGGNGGGGAGGGGGGAGGGTPRGGGGAVPPGAGPGPQPGDPRPFGSNPFSPQIGQQARDNTFGGVNVNNLDRGTPGWLSDPSAGTTNTSGFPNATLPAPMHGESFDEYMTRLHDAGFGSDDIFSAMGRNGYSQQGTPDRTGPPTAQEAADAGNWNWGWGTGPVVRGENGYQFAREAGGGGGGYGGGAAGGSNTNGGSVPDTLSSLLIPLY